MRETEKYKDYFDELVDSLTREFSKKREDLERGIADKILSKFDREAVECFIQDSFEGFQTVTLVHKNSGLRLAIYTWKEVSSWDFQRLVLKKSLMYDIHYYQENIDMFGRN